MEHQEICGIFKPLLMWDQLVRALVVSMSTMLTIPAAARDIYPGRSDYLVFSH